MNFPTYDINIHKLIAASHDPVRYATLALAINQVKKNDIAGCFAEVGVWRGDTSKIIHMLAPERIFYLFDTFDGFPVEDLENKDDIRFKDTGIDIVKKR